MALKPGETALGPACIHGLQRYELCDADGRTERGTMETVGDDYSSTARGDGLVEIGERLRPGVHRLDGYVRFTSRGPAAVASPAYRSGWEETFGKKGARSSN
jgi:hypothetical protein